MNTKKWMSYLDGSKNLTEFTIPGTHDSGTYPSMVKPVKCQYLDIAQQLNAGIRFFDIRLKRGSHANHDHVLWVYHGGIPYVSDMEISFSGTVMNVCREFLTQNPSETILMSIKNESGPADRGSIEDFYNDLVGPTNIARFPSLFYTENRIPKLDDVRGKIILIRRFGLGNKADIGLNLFNKWPHDKSDDFNNDDIDYSVQDAYNNWSAGADHLKKKFNNWVLPLLTDAVKAKNLNRLYFNFTSAAGGINPISMATGELIPLFDGVNKMLSDYLSGRAPARYGIVAMDYPEQPDGIDLIQKLISCNDFGVDQIFNAGIYEIRPKQAIDFCLDVNGNKDENNAGVIIHSTNGQKNQRWQLFKPRNFDFCMLRARNTTNKFLTLNGVNDGASIKIHTESDESLNMHYWKMEYNADSRSFYIRPKADPAKCLELVQSNIANGAKPTLSNFNGKPSQQWVFVKVGSVSSIDDGKIYEIKPYLAKFKRLDVFENRADDGTHVIVSGYNGGKNQEWQIIRAGEGYYYLRPKNAPGKVLTVDFNKTGNETQTFIYPESYLQSQLWDIEYDADNSEIIYLKPRIAPNKALELFEGNTTSGTYVTIHDANKSDAQKWVFTQITPV